MRCNHCDRIINKEENFYEINGEVYCTDCVKESTITYYTIGEDSECNYTDEEMAEYNDLDEYIENLKERMEWINERKTRLEAIEEPNMWDKYDLKKCKEEFKEVNEILDRIQNEEEEEE